MTSPVPTSGPGRPAARTPSATRSQNDVASLVVRLRAGGGTAALCGLCHAQISSVSGVGLTIFASPARRFVLCTSGRLTDHVEDLQIRLGQGPCGEAYTSGESVMVEHLAGPEARRAWPQFAAEALRVGIAAVFAFPVHAGTQPIAVLDLCRTSPGPLPADAYRLARTFAAAASSLLVDDLHSGSSAGAAVSVPAARAQQATGMVMGQATVGAAAALHRLRQNAFDRDLPLSAVVDEVLAGVLRFDPRPAA